LLYHHTVLLTALLHCVACLDQSDARFYLLDTARTFPPTAPSLRIRVVVVPAVRLVAGLRGGGLVWWVGWLAGQATHSACRRVGGLPQDTAKPEEVVPLTDIAPAAVMAKAKLAWGAVTKFCLQRLGQKKLSGVMHGLLSP